jgi:broad specificity phosphatase PhoE
MLLMNNSRAKLQHRPFLTPIWVTVGVAGAALLFALFMVWVWGTAGSTTVIVIRHAEQDAGDQVDARLSAAGEQRAGLLARMFGGTGPGRLEAIYVSNTLRSRLTAMPLATRLGIPLHVAAEGDAKAIARRALREHGGGRVLIVTHRDTLPGIVAALSGVEDIPKLSAEDYGVIYVVTVPRVGHANLLRLNY